MTKVKIYITERAEREVDIEFPYYFRHNLDLDHTDSIICGKITEDMIAHTVQYTRPFGYNSKISYEIRVESEDGSYLFGDRYKSDKETYEAMLENAKKFLAEF